VVGGQEATRAAGMAAQQADPVLGPGVLVDGEVAVRADTRCPAVDLALRGQLRHQPPGVLGPAHGGLLDHHVHLLLRHLPDVLAAQRPTVHCEHLARVATPGTSSLEWRVYRGVTCG
jgi:hypothetical protein